MAKNILIVDDAAFMRMMIKDILTKNGRDFLTKKWLDSFKYLMVLIK